MQNNANRPDHVQEFIGKYEETNPISKYLVGGFYGALQNLIPDDLTTVLEAGCGAGYSAERILPMIGDASYEGSDIGEELIVIAKEKNPEIPFCVESIYDLQREDNSFDLTMALETLEHLDDPQKALQELVRVSRKYVILSVPREPLWHVLNFARLKYVTSLGNTPGHLNHWSKGGFNRFINKEARVSVTRSPIPWNMVLARVDT